MKPPQRKMEFEKISTDDFVTGVIENIEYDHEHLFKGFKDAEDKIQLGVRLVFNVDGYKFPHKTPWMKFNYSSKANIYKKYIQSLVKGAIEYMDFDLDQLKGMKVKMLWRNDGDYQHIETIRPLEGLITPLLSTQEPVINETDESEIPF